jgi:hypothetical protein
MILLNAVIHAQRPDHDKIKAYRTAHITEQLDLKSSEAEKFWPIYNSYDNKIEELRIEERTKIFSKIRNGGLDALTDKEANDLIDRFMEIKTLEINYRKEMIGELRNVISPKKIIKLNRAEESFKRMLLERLKQRRGKR